MTQAMRMLREPTAESLLWTFSDQEEMMAFLMRGGEFLRFRNKGKPVIVHVDASAEAVYWGPKPHPSTYAKKKDNMGVLAECLAVTAGKATGVFQIHSTDELSPPEYCFSIIFESFSVDLQVESTRAAESVEVRNKWVAALNILLDNIKHGG